MSPSSAVMLIITVWLTGCGAFLIGQWCMLITDLTSGWPMSGLWFLAMGPGPFLVLLVVLSVRFVSRIGNKSSSSICAYSPDGEHQPETYPGNVGGVTRPKRRCSICWEPLP